MIALLTTACNTIPPIDQDLSSEPQDLQSPKISKIEPKSEVSPNCPDLKRFLNPAPQAPTLESDLDRHFRLAYAYEIEGNFDQAILNYQQAAKLSQCACDRLHAEAGEKAATEARELWQKRGMAARPTQFFWGRLQELTQELPCIAIR